MAELKLKLEFAGKSRPDGSQEPPVVQEVTMIDAANLGGSTRQCMVQFRETPGWKVLSMDAQFLMYAKKRAASMNGTQPEPLDFTPAGSAETFRKINAREGLFEGLPKREV